MSAAASLATDVQDLRKRLQQYEGKLATLTVINGALQNENDGLRADTAKRQGGNQAAELAELQEEFQRRLAAADRTVSLLKDERDALRGAANRAARGGDTSAGRLADAQALVSALQSEGEALARKNGELEAALRRVRAGVRESDAELDRLSERVESLESKLQAERAAAAEAAADAAAAGKAASADLAAERANARKEIAAAGRRIEEAAAAASSARGDEAALAAAQQREAQLTASLQELRGQMEQAAVAAEEVEARLRREAASAEGRARHAEAALSEAAASSSDSTRPLLRQIESISAAAAAQQRAAAEAEARWQVRLRDADAAAAAAMAAERDATQRAVSAEAAAVEARRSAAASHRDASAASAAAEAERDRAAVAAADAAVAQSTAENVQRAQQDAEVHAAAAAAESRERLWATEERAKALAASAEALQRRLEAAEAAGSISAAAGGGAAAPNGFERPPTAGNSGCETGGRGREHPRVPDAAAALMPPRPDDSSAKDADDLDVWVSSLALSPGDDHFSKTLHSLRGTDSIDGAASAARLAALEQQVRAAEAQRDAANDEALRAAQRERVTAGAAATAPQLRMEVQEQERRLALCLEALGERAQHIEQLEADVADMKAVFRGALETAVAQLAAAKAAEVAALERLGGDDNPRADQETGT